MTVSPLFEKPMALKDKVYHALREQVRQGKLSENDRLVDATLAKEMNISRTPVREALQLLVHEGLLVSTTRGFKLGELSQTQVGHLFELRLLLEPKVARKAAEAAGAFEVAQLLECVKRADHAATEVTPALFNAAVYQFFETLTGLCDNHAMVRSVQLYHDRLAQLRVLMMASVVHRQWATQGFLEIAQAIEAGDGPAAEAASARHIRSGIIACRETGLLSEDQIFD